MPGLIAIHPWNRRFENRYGAQDKLLQHCYGLLAKAVLHDRRPHALSPAVLVVPKDPPQRQGSH